MENEKKYLTIAYRLLQRIYRLQLYLNLLEQTKNCILTRMFFIFVILFSIYIKIMPWGSGSQPGAQEPLGGLSILPKMILNSLK